MAMRVSRDNRFALTVSADHLVGRYDISVRALPPSMNIVEQFFDRANRILMRDVLCIALNILGMPHLLSAMMDGYVPLAVGTASTCENLVMRRYSHWWDRIRLYSTKNLKPLGTLVYHKLSCQATEFARTTNTAIGGPKDDDFDEAETAERGRWLIAGNKDNRISIWSLMSFEKSK